MRSVLLVVLVVFVFWYVRFVIKRRGDLVAKRGMSVGADLAAMNDKARVRVGDVARIGPERLRVVLRQEDGADLDMVVALREGDFGDGLLEEWRADASWLAIVIPEGSHLVRLRAVESLQPLTLRRVDG